MKISDVNQVSANPVVTRKNKSSSLSFGVKLSLSPEACKYMADTARNIGIERAGREGTVADIYKGFITKAIDSNMNRLVGGLDVIKPRDYPVVLDLTEECKHYFATKGTSKGFNTYHNQEFELCPRGEHQTGKPHIASFNLNFNMIPEQFDRLYFVVIDRLEHGLWK